MHILILLFLIFLTEICSAQDLTIWMKDATTLVIEGRITKNSTENFKKIDLTNVRTLIITSPGGEVYSAVEIGKAIRKYGIIVDVPNYCFSACANWIFLPARQKNLHVGAVLGLHRGSAEFAMVRMLYELSGNKIEEERFLLAEASAKSLYEDANISNEIYSESAKKTLSSDPKLIYEIKNQDGSPITLELGTDREKNSVLLKKYLQYKIISYRWDRGPNDLYWFPSKNDLKKFGITGIGEYWYPTSKKMVEKIEDKYKIRFVGDWN